MVKIETLPENVSHVSVDIDEAVDAVMRALLSVCGEDMPNGLRGIQAAEATQTLIECLAIFASSVPSTVEGGPKTAAAVFAQGLIVRTLQIAQMDADQKARPT